MGIHTGLYHPIRLIGAWIAWLEQKLHKEETPRNEKKERVQGTYLVLAVLLVTGLCVAGILTFAYLLHPAVGVIVESVMTYQILATKCLKVESMRVYTCLKKGDLPAARQAVSMIVGRDTANLDETGVAKAAIETVAENTSDGVIAPMLYTALFGPILGFLYKAVNTMDSMVGYKNDKYLFFGRTAAKLDDVVNYIPARISAWLLILAGIFSGQGVFRKRSIPYLSKRPVSARKSQFRTDRGSMCRCTWHTACRGCVLFWKKSGKTIHWGCNSPGGGRGYQTGQSSDVPCRMDL